MYRISRGVAGLALAVATLGCAVTATPAMADGNSEYNDTFVAVGDSRDAALQQARADMAAAAAVGGEYAGGGCNEVDSVAFWHTRHGRPDTAIAVVYAYCWYGK